MSDDKKTIADAARESGWPVSGLTAAEIAWRESSRGMALVYDPLAETHYAVEEEQAEEAQRELDRRAREGVSFRLIPVDEEEK